MEVLEQETAVETNDTSPVKDDQPTGQAVESTAVVSTSPVEDGQPAQQVVETAVNGENTSPSENSQPAQQVVGTAVEANAGPTEEEQGPPLTAADSDKSPQDTHPIDIERTDSGVEGDTGNGPQVLEGDNVESFSSVKHLLS